MFLQPSVEYGGWPKLDTIPCHFRTRQIQPLRVHINFSPLLLDLLPFFPRYFPVPRRPLQSFGSKAHIDISFRRVTPSRSLVKETSGMTFI